MLRFNNTKSRSFPLSGGLDLVSSFLKMPPGRCISCDNIEIIGGQVGYTIPGGYERCTNDTLPSETKLYFFKIKTVTTTINTDDEFTDGTNTIKSLETVTSPADGTIIAVASHDSSFTDGSTFTKTGNSFVLEEVVIDTSSYTSEQIGSYTAQAIEQTRDAIPVVSGTGNILGGFRLKGDNYVFRGGKLYKGDDYSWSEITMPDVLYFNEGTVELTVGDTVTDGTATGVITSLTLQSGAWDSGVPAADQAEGYITIISVSGTFTAGLSLTDDHTGAAKVKTANTTYTLPSTGKYKTINYNFTDDQDGTSTYGVCGTGDAFEFDGTNYIPIFHPDQTDYPFHIDIHQERLQLHFPGGVFAYSVSGQPRVYNSLLGSGTWSTGDEITGSRVIHGNAQIIFTEKSSWLLVGDGIYSDTTATRNWQFYESGEKIGATPWSISGNVYPIWMSMSSVFALLSTEKSGGYISTSIADDIEPFLKDNKNNVIGAIWCRDKSQYRLFFSTGRAVYISFSRGKVSGYTTLTIHDGITNVWHDIEGESEYMFFTSDDGYLYRMDSGNTFDTNYREGSFRIPFHHYGSPRIEKLFSQIIIEFDSPSVITGDTEITYTVNHNYGSPDSPRPVAETLDDVPGAGGLYGSNDGYGGFIWSGSIVSEIQAYIDGYGSNMSILITYKNKYDSSFTFLTAIVDFIELGIKGQR
jgi:hypothetical protein